ncbi:MAG: gamma carbonic anhydrase family protein [Actinobacteria bacterium]|nr:gamma carbonic anhydrase family protein [Actinomycetota bacterium]MBU1944316.1 gamma carbonic anhydrase family protein [Actinomycetota bacterium]MBU2688301.1 gamma carbonic anhydrase family protein [Actinomycetota bacterium]
MALYEFEGRRPRVGRTSFIHDTAVLIGSVTIGENCLVSAGACLRADWGELIVGDGSNIQENVVIHAGFGAVMRLAENSHVGHGAILHNCTLEEHVMVGMGAIVQDRSVVGEGSVIGAGAVVLPGTEIPPGSLVVGVPARVVREVGEPMAQATWYGTRLYQTLPGRCYEGLCEIPLAECFVEPASDEPQE